MISCYSKYFKNVFLATVLVSISNFAFPQDEKGSFELLDPKVSGFDFMNVINEDKLKNPFNYVYAYNGGGVGIGDINNDGLPDIYMTGNMTSSALFLNKGDMKFEDISESAGVQTVGWCSATAMADVNDDGWLDIYVCRAYEDEPAMRENLLFINNQDNTFTESAKSYGLNDPNFGSGATFFDYDKDGDLDLFVLNHPRYRLVSMRIHMSYADDPPPKFSNRLFRNNGDNTFTDVTVESGLLDYSFSLGVCATDMNNDSWPDLYITVDFDEPDIVMLNDQKGGFTNHIDETFNSISRFSMGIDAGDINNDGFTDFVVSEMLNSTHIREKAEMAMLNVDTYNYFVDSLNYKSYQMRNYMHINNGNGTYSDIARIANIHKTDWSWSPLLFDYDNDGDLDLSITNGYYRDIINRDRKRTLDSTLVSYGKDMRRVNSAAAHYARNCPQTKLSNFLFRNNGDLTFEDVKEATNTDQKTLSNGSAYADLDNDGDLDLVVNNLGEPSFIYENKSEVGNFLRVEFEYEEGRPYFGAIVEITAGAKKYRSEVLSARGFQSSSEHAAHFGLGDIEIVDALKVTWPDGLSYKKRDPKVNAVHKVRHSKAIQREREAPPKVLVKRVDPKEIGLSHKHIENAFNDYGVQVLLPHKMSEQGPFISKADVNGDGSEDVFIAGPSGQSGAIYIQTENGFELKRNPFLEVDIYHEDGEGLFFDADSDGDQDLLVCSGGYEFSDPRAYEQRLYLNDGTGLFTRKSGAFPNWNSSVSCARANDIDDDGDLDIFFGGRLYPRQYPLPGYSSFFLNDGTGNFTNYTVETSPEIERIGMVKDAMWHDFNGDGANDLMIVGEWMSIKIFIFENGKLVDRSKEFLGKELTGWWNTIEKADLDNDGFQDFVIGNLGLNYKYKASNEMPFIIYAKDFDGSGSCDIALAEYEGDELYPVRGRACSVQQIPDLKKQFPKFDLFAAADMESIYGDGLSDATKYEANEFASVILYGKQNGFDAVRLPNQSQISPINGIVVHDINKDGKLDLIHAGNLFQSEIETGRADAGVGQVLINKGNREWDALAPHESGMCTRGDVKSIELIEFGKEKRHLILVGNNSSDLEVIEIKK